MSLVEMLLMLLLLMLQELLLLNFSMAAIAGEVAVVEEAALQDC